MGWSVYLTSNKEIKEKEIDEIVEDLPEKYSSSLGNSKQSWGWSTGADISIRQDGSIRLSGSYGLSGKIAEDYSAYLKDRLENKGHNISIEHNW